jgi:hypothetical protein
MFQDKVPGYPDNKMTLGRYLGPATDTGSARMSKILKANDQFSCRSMLQEHLDDTELQSPMHQKEKQMDFFPGSTLLSDFFPHVTCQVYLRINVTFYFY